MAQNQKPNFLVMRPAPASSQGTGASGSGAGLTTTSPEDGWVIREHRQRRTHTKSRAGCWNCKTKKVKCDQGQPKCGKCTKAGAECIYPSPAIAQSRRRRTRRDDEHQQPPRQQQEQQQPALSPELLHQRQQQEQLQHQHQQLQQLYQQRLSASLSRSSRSGRSPLSQLIPLSQPTFRPNIPMFHGPKRATSGAQLIHHLVNNFRTISGNSIPWALVKFSHPHLLSACLTIAASHLDYHTTESHAHHLAQRYQLQFLCTNFNEALKQRWCPGLADSLLTTSLALHMLVFLTVDSEDPSTSWVRRTDPGRLDWLDFQLRLTPLVQGMMNYQPVSALPVLYAATTSPQDMVLSQTNELHPAQIPVHWCGLLVRRDGDTFDPDELFRGPLNAIYQTTFADPDPSNLFQYLQLAGKMDHRFLARLQVNDERALWIFGYWFGLMGKMNVWWVRRRVMRDYFAILDFLTPFPNNPNLDEPTRNMWYLLLQELIFLQNNWWWQNIPQPMGNMPVHGLTEAEVVQEVMEVQELPIAIN